ncbi:MAG: hypothetical protein IKV94_05165 [Clostridia bacterium]|nr:hypothetical protein [Clostridia bacterium]
MNYQTTMLENVNIMEGDVIEDSKSPFCCTVKKIKEDSVEFSEIQYSHPVEITMFALKAFEVLKKKLNVSSVNFIMRRGCIRIDEHTREKQLYHELINKDTGNW